MNFYDTLYSVAREAGISIERIGYKLGRTARYVGAAKSRGSVPSVDNAARMLDVCGYGLYAIPYSDAPVDALQITYEEQTEHAPGNEHTRDDV